MKRGRYYSSQPSDIIDRPPLNYTRVGVFYQHDFFLILHSATPPFTHFKKQQRTVVGWMSESEVLNTTALSFVCATGGTCVTGCGSGQYWNVKKYDN